MLQRLSFDTTRHRFRAQLAKKKQKRAVEFFRFLTLFRKYLGIYFTLRLGAITSFQLKRMVQVGVQGDGENLVTALLSHFLRAVLSSGSPFSVNYSLNISP